MNDALLFPVIRRCNDCGLICEPGCNCDHITVDVDVDELTAVEVAHFTAHGTAAQRVEITTYFAPEASMFKCSSPVSSCGPTCPCSECVAARIPSTCPEGCDCLVCLVDGLSANPPPRRPADARKAA